MRRDPVEIPACEDPRIAREFIARVDRGLLLPDPEASVSTPCWRWTGSIDLDGYGKFYVARKCYRAHRYSLAIFREGTPRGLTIHHLCLNRNCVNPGHLEAVPNAENCSESQRRRNSRIDEIPV